MSPKITDEEFLAARKEGKTYREIAEEFGMNIRSVERRGVRLARQGHLHGNAHVAKHIPDGFGVKGTSTMIRADGSEVVRWVKSEVDRDRMVALMEAAQAVFCEDLPRAEPQPLDESKFYIEDQLALYPIFDLHIGAMAHKHECGENYDTSTAEKVLNRFFDYSVSVAPQSQKAVLLVGGDFLHSDGLDAVTPASGHVLDQDSRYAKLVYVAIRSLRRAVSLLLNNHAEVEVQVIEGNHDQAGMIWLRAALAAFYENEPRVFGHTMKKPETRLAAIATDFRKEFGQCDYIYTHSGHWHHQTVTEHSLGIDEVHGQLGAKDAYAARGGWRSYRQAAVILYSKEYGEVGRFIYRPNM